MSHDARVRYLAKSLAGKSLGADFLAELARRHKTVPDFVRASSGTRIKHLEGRIDSVFRLHGPGFGMDLQPGDYGLLVMRAFQAD